MKKIVLDTNILMAVAQFKFDLFGALESGLNDKYAMFVLDKTIIELEKLINQARLSQQKAAKLALSLIASQKIGIIPTESNQKTVDDELCDLKGYSVVTQDKELKRRLKERGIEVLTMRQKKTIITG